MKTSIILLTFLTTFCLKCSSQGLHSITPKTNNEQINEKMKSQNLDPEISRNGSEILYNGDLIFNLPFNKVYDHFFERYKENGNEYLIITPILQRENNNAGIGVVQRNLAYIISLQDDYQKYYTDFKDLYLNDKEHFDYYKGGTIIKEISIKERKMFLLSGDKGKEEMLELNLYNW